MRIAIAIFAHSAYFATASTCEAICNGLAECAANPNAQGSYCKSDHNPQVCFGLYYNDETRTSMCYQPNNESCREDFPVVCPTSVPTCEQRCQTVEACREAPHPQWSYCKDDHVPRTCFGLYFTDATETNMCFQPNDASCDESRPVLC